MRRAVGYGKNIFNVFGEAKSIAHIKDGLTCKLKEIEIVGQSI